LLPPHIVVPAMQVPAHCAIPVPIGTHVAIVPHDCVLPQLPLASHVCTPVPLGEHCVLPGVHRPSHVAVDVPALTQAWLTHATVSVHGDSVPFGRQVSRPCLQRIPAGVPPSSVVLHVSG
jgi:hypothetical protein